MIPSLSLSRFYSFTSLHYFLTLLNMAMADYAAFLAILLVFQPYSLAANFTIPFLSPFLGSNNNSCGENVCGKGNCVVSSSSTFGYECECDSGWKQARADDDDVFKFLPCVIPNCTLNYSCANAPPPNHKNATFSFIDPCFWSYCGGGSCDKTSISTHSCECDEGYFNLFNSTSFPCYKECAIGLDCATLGLNLSNSTTSRPGSNPSSADDSTSPAARLIPGVKFDLFIALGTTLALVIRKYG